MGNEASVHEQDKVGDWLHKIVLVRHKWCAGGVYVAPVTSIKIVHVRVIIGMPA